MLSMVCWLGCGLPGGGINRPCSLRTASSSSLASSPMLSGLMASKATPPAQSVELWHFSQYCSKKPHLLLGSLASGLSVAPAADGVDGGFDFAARARAVALPATNANPMASNTRRTGYVPPLEIRSINI